MEIVGLRYPICLKSKAQVRCPLSETTMYGMYHETYPVRRREDPLCDNFGRLLPKLPTRKFPTAAYQYRDDYFLHLHPHVKFAMGAENALSIKIIKKVHLGFRYFNQVVVCEVVKGPELLLGAEVVAIIYDSMYVDIFDLPVVRPGKPQRCHFSYSL